MPYCTVSVVVPVTTPESVVTVAVMVVCPDAISVATPELLMVATLVLLLVHCTMEVRSFVEESANVPVAMNCCVSCVCRTEGLEGERPIDDRVLAVTIRLAVPVSESCVAVMLAVPAETVVTAPALTVATAELVVFHVAVEVTSLAAPFTVVPLAVKVIVLPLAASREVGLIVIEAMESPEVKKPLQPLTRKMGTRDSTSPIRCTRRTIRPPLSDHSLFDRRTIPDLHHGYQNTNAAAAELLRQPVTSAELEPVNVADRRGPFKH